MPHIRVDQDIYDYVRGSRVEGESVEEALRRLLGLSRLGDDERSEELLRLLADRDFRADHTTATARFLAALACLHDQDPERFEKVVGLKGRSRIYLARSREAVEGAGRTTFPRLIPGTDLWALTNLRTAQKKQILNRVLRILDYGKETRLQVLRVLTSGLELVRSGREGRHLQEADAKIVSRSWDSDEHDPSRQGAYGAGHD